MGLALRNLQVEPVGKRGEFTHARVPTDRNRALIDEVSDNLTRAPRGLTVQSATPSSAERRARLSPRFKRLIAPKSPPSGASNRRIWLTFARLIPFPNASRMEDRVQKALIKRLNLCLKRPENLVCVDCPMRLPRWASTNLGVFMCTNCSGIHRGLGVHISRVRSTQLDKWTEEQVAFMERMGNVRANEYWEKNLQPGAKPKSSEMNVVERYIRNKYEHKQYVDRNVSGPTPGDANGNTTATPVMNASAPAAPAAPAAPMAPAAPAAGGGMFDLLDLATPAAPAAAPVVANTAADAWADFSSAPVAAPAAPSAKGGDGWADFAGAPAAAPAAPAPAAAPASAVADGWDAFASAPRPPLLPPLPRLPRLPRRPMTGVLSQTHPLPQRPQISLRCPRMTL